MFGQFGFCSIYYEEKTFIFYNKLKGKCHVLKQIFSFNQLSLRIV